MIFDLKVTVDRYAIGKKYQDFSGALNCREKSEEFAHPCRAAIVLFTNLSPQNPEIKKIYEKSVRGNKVDNLFLIIYSSQGDVRYSLLLY